MCSLVELDAEVKDKEREFRKINYTSVKSLAFFVGFGLVFLSFSRNVFLCLFVAFPLWFGEFLRRRSLLQVSLMYWNFLLFPIDKHVSCFTSPRLHARPPNSYSLVWQTSLSSQILITSVSHPLSYIMKAEPVLLQGALVAPFCFCWCLLYRPRLARGLCRLLTCLRPTRSNAERSQLAVDWAVLRNSFSIERFCSLFVDCRYGFVL